MGIGSTIQKRDKYRKFRERLIAQHRSLSRQIKDVDQLSREVSGDEVQDLGDRSTQSLGLDITLDIAAAKSDNLRRIEAALQRMDRGTYGECVECGGEINPLRLEADPAVLRCSPCQERFEARAKVKAPGM